jgi:hypothetical protein
MQRAFFMALIAGLVYLVVASDPVRAGTLPDITGTWHAQGDAAKRCEISQSGDSVTLRNEQGRTATGRFTDPSTLDTDWGYFGGRHIKGVISSDLRRINWSNGTYWTRASSPQPTPTPNPYRGLTFATASLAHTSGPIAIVDAWGAVKRDGKGVVVCISFKDREPVAATRVVFAFPLRNRDGETLETLHLDRRGTFSPNVEIRGWESLGTWQQGFGHRGYADNCVTKEADVAALSLLTAHFVSYRIVHVEFADGSIWPKR